MAKPKKGRVVRLTPDLVKLVSESQHKGETIPSVIRRLLTPRGLVRFVLPSDIYETVEDARGVAVMKAVKSKAKRAEKPIAVRVKE